MGQNVRSVLLDRNASYKQLVAATAHLPPRSDADELWARIANDPDYPRPHRRFCVLQLFLRRVSTGMTLAEIAKVLDHPAWLEKEDIEQKKDRMGLWPAAMFGRDDAVFVIRLLPEIDSNASGVAIMVEGVVSYDELFNMLKNKAGSKEVAAKALVAIGVEDASVWDDDPAVEHRKSR